MFCEHCGAEMSNLASFCKKCGKSVESTDGNPFEDIFSGSTDNGAEAIDNDYYANSDMMNCDLSDQPMNNESDAGQSQKEDKPAADAVFADAPSAYQEPEKDKSKLVTGLIAIIIVLVVALAGIIVWFSARKDDSPEENQETTSQSAAVDAVIEEELTEIEEEEEEIIPLTGKTRLLDAYDENAIFAPEKLYNDIEYYVCYSLAALYSESGGYSRGQIAQLEANDVVVVKGAMEDSNWVYVYCKELGIYGWIEPDAISPERVVESFADSDRREVYYYSDAECRDAIVNIRNDDTLNLRTTASKLDDSTIVYRIPNGEVVEVIGYSTYDSAWLYVRYDSPNYGEIYGFMSGPDLKLK